jgi:glucans biosynthesis protein C
MDDKGPPSLPIPTQNQGRLPGLEELRALAAVLVVGLHAGVPYLYTPMIGLIWPTRDPRPSVLVDAIFWGIESFIMPLFFVLSGWSAATLFAKKTGWTFVVDRSRRVLLPLGVAMLLILPLVLYVWVTGWVIYLNLPAFKLRSLRFDGEIRSNIWGLAHLWYLEYLYLYCLALAGLAWVTPRRGLNERPRFIVPLGLLPAGMMLAGAIILAWDNRIVLGFYQTYFPVPSKLAYYAIYFFAGVGLKRLPHWQISLRRWSPNFGLAAIAAFTCLLPLIHARPEPGFDKAEHVMLAIALASFGVSTTLAIFGFFLTRSKPAHPWVIGVAEASLWIYMMHLPAVGLMQIDLGTWTGATALKFALVWGMAMIWTLLTYEGLVRKTWLGRLLHGERQLVQRGFSMTTLRAMLVTSRSKAA